MEHPLAHVMWMACTACPVQRPAFGAAAHAAAAGRSGIPGVSSRRKKVIQVDEQISGHLGILSFLQGTATTACVALPSAGRWMIIRETSSIIDQQSNLPPLAACHPPPDVLQETPGAACEALPAACWQVGERQSLKR